VGSVCVHCARHLVAKVNGLKQTRSTLRHNGRFGQSCVCVFLVTLKGARSNVVPCGFGVCSLRQASRGQSQWPQTNAIHSAPQWSVQSKLCVCVFLVTLKSARFNVVPFRFGVRVCCDRHLVAKLYALDRANAIHSAPQCSVRSKLCVCVFGNPQCSLSSSRV